MIKTEDKSKNTYIITVASNTIATYHISTPAYTKAILHAHKYAFSSVCGVLLGTEKDNKVLITDAVPLFHTPPLAPMFEVAMIQIEEYFQQKGVSIVGCYFANEAADDKQLSNVSKRIADKLITDFESACVLLINNSLLSSEPTEISVQAYTKKGGDWKSYSSSNSSTGIDFSENDTLAKLGSQLSQQKQNTLVDFDNHLDDTTKDWLNPHLNK